MSSGFLGAVVIFALIAVPAASAPPTGSLRLTVGAGYDSNASRDYQEVGTDPDAMLLALVSLQGKLLSPRFALSGKYDGGARKFLLFPSEDVLAQAAALDGGISFGDVWTVGLTTRIKDRRGSDRSYSDLWGGGYLSFTPDAQLQFKFTAAGHRFLYWPNSIYTYGAPEIALSAHYSFTARHQVYTFGEHGARRYAQQSRVSCLSMTLNCQYSNDLRHDTSLAVGGGYAYRGRFSFSATYTYWELASSSFGESQRRHRVDISAGFRLPWKLMLFTQGSLTLTRYTDGVFFSPDQSLVEDDESTNSVAIRLVRPLGRVFDVEVRSALYQARFLSPVAASGLSYWRHVVWAGVTWRP